MITDFKLFDVVATTARNGRTIYGVVDGISTHYGHDYDISIHWLSRTNIKSWWSSDDIDPSRTKSKLIRLGGVDDIITKYNINKIKLLLNK